MRKIVLLAVMVAMAALMLTATPAMADDHKRNDNDWKHNDWKHNDWKDNDWKHNDWNNHYKRFFNDDKFDHFDEDDFCDFFKCDDFDEDDFDFGDFDFEQDAESGDVNQTYVITNTGDNSNQCVGLQSVANTGNAQDQTSLFQIGSDTDDFDFDNGGSNIDMSPTNTTTCDQEVNQAATAYHGGTHNNYYPYW